MKTFNVGPSRVSEETKRDIKEAVDDGVLEVSHRSEEFSKISEDTIRGLRELLKIPDDYEVLYTSSATQAMQIAIANCCDQKSFHFACGSFSGLFAKVAVSLGKDVHVDEVESGLINDYEGAQVADDADFVSITHNETSTGVQVSQEQIRHIRENNPNKILAVDVTSSVGASPIDISDADIWLFSVQKCFGLPAGLGIIILSKRAVEKAENLSAKGNKIEGYFSLGKMLEKMKGKYQTLDTPNILDIHLFSKKLERWNKRGGLENNVKETFAKEALFSDFIESQDKISFFAKNKICRSTTVFCLESEEEIIEEIHKKAKERGLILGKGYGELKNKTFRIANFPSSDAEDVGELIDVLKSLA